MRRRIGTVATCGILMFSVGVPAATADVGAAGRDKVEKCQKLYNKYVKALNKGQTKKAERLIAKYEKKGCFKIGPPIEG